MCIRDRRSVSRAALKRLMGYPWPGNVRQLENVCHWLTVMAPTQTVGVKDLPPEIREAALVPEVAAVALLASVGCRACACVRSRLGGEAVGPVASRPYPPHVDPVRVVTRLLLLPAPVGVPPHGLRPVVVRAVEEDLGCGRLGQQGGPGRRQV